MLNYKLYIIITIINLGLQKIMVKCICRHLCCCDSLMQIANSIICLMVISSLFCACAKL